MNGERDYSAIDPIGRKNGGPLFPQRFDSAHGGTTFYYGATLRDYFIAHAPTKPQKWFMPVMATECPIVPSLHAIEDQGLRDAVNNWLESDCSDEYRPRVEQWCSERSVAEKAQAAWQAEFRKQLYVQWPAAWADEMVKARAA